MSSYIGVRCPVCNKKFIESDDIVVCPICGAPHHRDCYLKENACAFAADHLSGKVWTDPSAQQTPPSGDADEKSGVQTCSRCGASNPDEAIFCQVCGHPMRVDKSAEEKDGHQEWSFPGFQMQIDPISMAYGGLSPDETIEGESVRDLARYIGPGSAYYLPRFRMIAQNPRSISVSFSALFFNFIYYFYRKMYLVGAFLLLVFCVSSIPSYLQLWELCPLYLQAAGLLTEVEVNQAAITHFQNLFSITQSISFFIGVAVSLFANRYYCNRVIREVRRIREANSKEGQVLTDYQQELAKAGGTSKGAAIAVIGTLFLLQVAISCVMIYLRLSTGG